MIPTLRAAARRLPLALAARQIARFDISRAWGAPASGFAAVNLWSMPNLSRDFSTKEVAEVDGVEVDELISLTKQAIKRGDTDSVLSFLQENREIEIDEFSARRQENRKRALEQELQELAAAKSEEQRNVILAKTKKAHVDFVAFSKIFNDAYEHNEHDQAIGFLTRSSADEAKEMLSQFGPAKKARLFVHALFNEHSSPARHGGELKKFSDLLQEVLDSSDEIERRRTLDFIQIACDYYRSPKQGDVSWDMVTVAAKTGCGEALKLLIRAGVDTGFPSGLGNDALISAILSGIEDPIVMKHMAATTADPKKIGTECYAALHLVHARPYAKKVIGALIARGGDVNIEAGELSSSPGANIFHFMARMQYCPKHYEELMEFLVEKGGDLRKLTNRESYTPFQDAITYGNYKMADSFLSYGVGIDEVNPNTGLSCLAFFTLAGNEEAVEYLLSRGANPEVPAKKGINFVNGLTIREGQSVMEIAKKFQRMDIILQLAQAQTGMTPRVTIAPKAIDRLKKAGERVVGDDE